MLAAKHNAAVPSEVYTLLASSQLIIILTNIHVIKVIIS
jgi:hypothetical protein